MTSDEIKSAVLLVLGEIAPEADPSSIDPQVSFRNQLDIDSVDFLNFVLRLHKRFGVDIPEADYPRLATLDSCVEHLASVIGTHGKAD